MNENDPHYGMRSPDGHQWYDGENWQPVQQEAAHFDQPIVPTRSRTPLVIGTVVVGLLMLVGLVMVLGSSEEPIGKPETVTSTQKPYTPPAPKYTPPAPSESKSDVAYKVLMDTTPSLSEIPVALVDEWSLIACDLLSAPGGSFDIIFDAGIQTGFDGEEIGGLTAYAIFVHCPENKYKVG